MPAKIPLLFLPGLLCDEALWLHQIKSLKTMAECQTADLTKHDSISALAQATLAKAPPKFALAALSMGGYVAMEIMRQAPERVLKLCLCDTSARPDTPEQKERRRLLLALAKSGKFKGVTPRLLPTLINAAHLQDEKITGTIMAMAERVGREAFQRQQTAIMNRIDSRPHLHAIRCPVQIIVGHEDVLTPPDRAKEIAAAVPGAQLDLIENCGHLAPLEQPAKVSEIMRKWLA